MAKRVVIDPITRIEGHLRIDVEVDGGSVQKAWASSTMWRGIEKILVGRDPRDAWAFTQRFCGVCTTVHALASVRAVEMIRVLHEEHAFADVFVSFLLARNARIQEDLVDQLFNSSEKRLARVLLLLAHFGKDKPETVVPKISQEVLAEMIGTTRSRVNFFMNRFRKLGFIEYNGGLHVHSSLLNVILHE